MKNKVVRLLIYSALIIGAIFLFARLFLWFGEIRSNELIGRAPIVLLKLPDQVIGFTWNDYAGFFIHGRGEDFVQCEIEQVWGGPIGDYTEGGLICLMVWRSEGRFRGWIDFRGHPRAFCGAELNLDLPETCLWK